MTHQVSIIVPTYRRAHLLAKTLPTYQQEGAGEILLIDDCSPDRTANVAEELRSRFSIPLRYLRQNRNMKQTAAKNRGVAEAKFDWVFFGDDDSVLIAGSLARLLDTQRRTGADLVGARAVFMGGAADENVESYLERATERASEPEEICDLRHFKFHFDKDFPEPIELPVTHACFLVRRELAARIRFDERFVGNCFREETDFTLRCRSAGAKLVWDPKAISVNLPKSVATGGARSMGRLSYEWNSLVNHAYFLRKNRKALAEVADVTSPWWLGAAVFLGQRVRSAVLKVVR